MATVTLTSLWFSSALMCVVMVLAWRMFGRQDHARTWAWMFGLGAVQWTLTAVLLLGAFDLRTGRLLGGGFMIATATLATIGCRQRVGLPTLRTAFVVGGAIGFAACALVAAVAPLSGLPFAIPYLYSAVTLLIGAHATWPRNREPNPAELYMVVALGLFALFQFVLTGIALHFSLTGDPVSRALYLRIVAIGLPPAYLSLGLAGGFLLAADLGERLRALVSQDPLTGALNRRGLEQVGVQMIANAVRHQRPVTLVLMDLDHFKAVNDGHGHMMGDRVLQRFAAGVKATVREEDVFARIGGDEFCLLLNEATEEQAEAAVARAREAIAAANAEADAVAITASFGISGLRVGDTLATMIERADAALYAAKHAGRDRAALAPTSKFATA